MQAFGSVAAIFGAIWIARTDERRRQIESLAVAEITAVETLGLLGTVFGCLGACSDAMSATDVSTAEFRSRRHDLDELVLPNSEDIRRLVPIGNEVAIDLIQIVTEISTAKVLLERAGREEMPLENRRLYAASLHRVVMNLPMHVSKSRVALIKFLQSRGHSVISDQAIANAGFRVPNTTSFQISYQIRLAFRCALTRIKTLLTGAPCAKPRPEESARNPPPVPPP
jgi:hypothetical protein